MEIENKTVESIPAVTIRFAGDSGDGMQLVGTRSVSYTHLTLPTSFLV